MDSTAYLIDTDAVFRLGLKRLLEKEFGIRVSGESARIDGADTDLSTSQPNMLIIDPGRQVYESFAEIRRFTAECPSAQVVLLSEQLNPATAKEALILRLDAYAVKPVSQSEIISLLTKLVRGQRYIATNYTNSPPSAGGDVTDINCSVNLQQSKLSDRETQILVRTVNGRTAADIAEEFDISIKTAEWHRRNVYSKLKVKNVAELTKFALRVGIIALD